MTKIYSNFKLILCLLFLHTAVFSMEEINIDIPDSPETISTAETDSFILKTDEHIFLFEAVDFFNLSPRNRALYVEASNDFDAVSQMFDTSIACLFKVVSWFKEDIAYEMMILKMTEEKNKYPNGYKLFQWFIFDALTYDYVGTISLNNPAKLELSPKTLSDFQIHTDSIWGLGAALTKPYRGRKIASKLTPLFLDKMRSFSFLQNEWVTIQTRTSNAPTHRLASKYGFSHLESQEKIIDFGIWTKKMDMDVFGMQMRAEDMANDVTSPTEHEQDLLNNMYRSRRLNELMNSSATV